MGPPPAGAAGAARAGGLVLWLHGSSETGEQSRTQVAPYFSDATFGGANRFGIRELPITATTVRDEEGVLEAVEHVREMLDKEVLAGMSPTNIFVCGLSQGDQPLAATGFKTLLIERILISILSIPLSKSLAERVPPEAKKTSVLWFHGMADGVVLSEVGPLGVYLSKSLTYRTLGHSLVDEELRYFRPWTFDHLGISQGTYAATQSSSS
ncbi:hypothetical protein VPH35_032581 [Triticum aestivum]